MIQECYKLVPSNWRSNPYSSRNYETYTLSGNTHEYKQAVNALKSKLKCNVREVKRIENKFAYISFMIEKDKYVFMQKRKPKEEIVIKKTCKNCIDKLINLNGDKRIRCHHFNSSKTNKYVLFRKLGLYSFPEYLFITKVSSHSTEMDDLYSRLNNLFLR